MSRKSTSPLPKAFVLVADPGRLATKGVFSDISSSGGFSARVMNREAFDRAVDSADRKLKEVTGAEKAKT